MKRMVAVLAGAALMAVLPLTGSSAAPVTHRVTVNAGQLRTWQGTEAVGANTEYSFVSNTRVCGTEPQTMCEYALVTLNNPVPLEDEDGRVRKTVTITLEDYSIPSPGSDFVLRVLETDSEGSVMGNEVGFSDNSEVPDPDEQVTFSVETTLENPTRYYLVEVAYFTSLGASYRGVVNFGQPAAKILAAPPGIDRSFELTQGAAGTWDGNDETVGVNPNFHPWAPQASDIFPVEDCSKDPNYYCDLILLKYTNPMTEEDIAAQKTFRSRGATVTIGNYTFPGSDLDLRIWESNEAGEALTMITDTGEAPGSPESASFVIRTTLEEPSKWVLVQVGYWAGIGGYDGSLTF